MNQANPNQLTIGDAHRRFKNKPFSKTGRMSRSEFFLTAPIVPFGFQILCFIIMILGSSLSSLLSTPGNPCLWPFGLSLVLIVIIQIGLAVSMIGYMVRRLHDIGNSGWWIFINFIPVIGQAILIYKSLQASNVGDNQYGPQPLETQAMNPETDENQLGLWNNLLTIIKGAFSFKGRTSRHELALGWGFLYAIITIFSIAMSFLINGLYLLALRDIFQKAPFLLGNPQIIDMYLVQEYGAALGITGAIYCIVQFILFLVGLTFIAAMVRRLHDVGKSGYYIIAPIFLGLISLITLLMADSDLAVILFCLLFLCQGLVLLYLYYLLLKPSSTDTKYGPILPAFQEATTNSSELVEEGKANTIHN